MKNIKYNLASDSWGNEEISAINDVIKSNQYTMGPKVKKFEEEFSKFCGVKYGSTVSNGTVALHLAVKALELQKGDA